MYCCSHWVAPWLPRCSRRLCYGLVVVVCWLMVGLTPVQADTVTLNLRDAEIQTLIDLVAQETGQNFIVDPRVRGRVSVVSGRPVSRDELYDLFLGVLKVYGFAAVPGEVATKIMPDVQAKQGEILNLFEHERVASDEIVTHVLMVEHISAAQLVPILRPLIPQGGHLAAAMESNALVISDSAANIHRIRALIQRIDQPVTDDFEIIRLQHANARALAQQLRELETSGGGEAGMVRNRLRILADERANLLILSGDPARRLALRALILQLDTPVAAGNIQVHYLRYAQAADVAEVLRGIAESRQAAAPGGDAPAQERSVRVQAHESTNALVVVGPPEMTGELVDVIDRLDIRRAQVLVEAVIVEISSQRAAELGVQWAAGSQDSGLGVINFNRNDRGLLQLAANVESFLGGTVAAVNVRDGVSLGGVARNGNNLIAVLISALQSDSASNILSTPSLLTLDNEEAEIIVGQNVPFIAGRSVEDSGQAFDTIRREDVGVKLRIRPQINEGNAIRMEIEQEVSQIARDASPAADLITNTRSLRTHVIVDDGEMLVLGGLMDEQRSETQDQVPGLGRIPGLGRLFRYDSERVEKRNLMVFIYPRIIRDSGTGMELTSEKYSYIRRQQLQEAEHGARGFRGDTPILANWEALTALPPPFAEVYPEFADGP